MQDLESAPLRARRAPSPRSRPPTAVVAAASGFCLLIWLLCHRGPSDAVTAVLTNSAGIAVHILSTGAVIQRLYQPDRHGALADVVLGFDEPARYATGESPYFGAVAGRVANRIANATFSIDGRRSRVSVNEKGMPGCLHGGARGFDKVEWALSEPVPGRRVELRYRSPDGDQGFPGELDASVSYELNERNELLQEFTATVSGSPTPINLAQHSYFNLGGADSGESVLSHRLTLHRAEHVLPVDAHRIPTGALMPVRGTARDFTSSRAIGARIGEVDGPGWKAGYDQCWVLHNLGEADGAALRAAPWRAKPELAATLVHPPSGRTMELLTTAPGLQLYTSNFLDGSIRGKRDAAYDRYGGVCLETQNLPDAVNQAPRFPSAVLRPGEVYRHSTIYRFSAQ
jgi:aldose 1-epimerase